MMAAPTPTMAVPTMVVPTPTATEEDGALELEGRERIGTGGEDAQESAKMMMTNEGRH